MDPRLSLSRFVGGVALLPSMFCAAAAQEIPTPLPLSLSVPDASVFLAQQADLPRTPFSIDRQDYSGVALGEWRLYPFLYTGLSYDSNLLNANSGKVADAAFNFAPTFIATRNAGIQNTLVYGAAETSSYLRNSGADSVTGRIGFQHMWELQRDLVFDFAGDVSRSADLTNGGDAVAGAPFYPIYSNAYRISAAALKSFGSLFLHSFVALSDTQYDSTTRITGASLPQSYRDYSEIQVKQRVGYQFGQVFYVFSDTSLNWQDTYYFPASASSGYREVAGLGATRFGLLYGEIYAGYQAQVYRSALIGTVNDPVLGGRVGWSPRAFLSFVASLDETITTQDFVTPGNPLPAAVTALVATFGANYAPSSRWSLLVTANYMHDDYSNSPRSDGDFALAATFSCKLSRTLVASISTRQIIQDSSYRPASYSRNVSAIGVTYRY